MLQEVIDEHTDPWGVKVTQVAVKAVDLPQEMQRAMAKQAESEREKRAKIIHASGEFEASKQLTEAAHDAQSQPVGAAPALPADARPRSRPRRTRPSSSRCPIDWLKALMGERENSAVADPRRNRRWTTKASPCAARSRTPSVPELLRSLLGSGETGILTFRNGRRRQERLPAQGRIVYAASTDPDERLGENLLLRGQDHRPPVPRGEQADPARPPPGRDPGGARGHRARGADRRRGAAGEGHPARRLHLDARATTSSS